MADKKLNELPQLNTIAGDELLYTVSGSGDYRMATSGLSLYIKESITPEDIGAAASYHNHQAGIEGEPTITDNGNGTLTVAAGEVWFYTDSTRDELTLVSISNSGILTPTNDITEFVVADRNTSSWVILSSFDSIDYLRYIPYFVVLKRTGSNNMHFQKFEILAHGEVEEWHKRDFLCGRYKIEQDALRGLGCEETTLAITCGGGGVWAVGHRYLLPAVTTATRQFQCVHNGSSWSVSPSSHTSPIANNAEYQGENGLVALTDNYWTINYVYRGVEDQDHLYTVLSTTEFATDSLAQASKSIAALPELISSHAIFIGRIVVQKNATANIIVESAFDTVFQASSSITNHGMLSGLADDDHTQYHNDSRADSWLATKVGGGAGTICAGDDIRLSDPRTPMLSGVEVDTSPLDTDVLVGGRSGGDPLVHSIFKTTWTTIKTFLKTYFDTFWGNVVNKEQQIKHGFASSPANPSFSTNTFTLPVSTPFTVYINGVKKVFNSTNFPVAPSVTINTPVVGTQYFIFMKADYTLDYSTNQWDILDLTVIPVATAYYNASNDWITAKEWHSADRNLIEHKSQHETWGAQYVSGFTSANIATGSGNTFSLVGGTIRDEDLYSVISNPQTQCRIGYRDGTNSNKMKFDAAGSAYAVLNGSVPRYDSNGTLTDIPQASTTYGIYWMYATNRLTTPITVIMGQGVYSSVANAQAAAQPTLTGFSAAEWKLLYRIIIRRTGAATWALQQADPLYNVSAGPPVQAGAISTISAGNVTVATDAAYPNLASNAQDSLQNLDTNKANKGANTFTDNQNLNNNSLTAIETATFNGEYTISSTTGTIALDFTSYQFFKQTEPTGSITYNITPPNGPGRFQIRILSDGTSTAQTFAFQKSGQGITPKQYGQTWAATNNKSAILTLYYDGTDFHLAGSNEA